MTQKVTLGGPLFERKFLYKVTLDHACAQRRSREATLKSKLVPRASQVPPTALSLASQPLSFFSTALSLESPPLSLEQTVFSLEFWLET